MTILYFLTSLFGATMLLLYAVRMVQTGIERAYGPSFKRLITSNDSALRAMITGVVMAIVLQSATAVTLLTAGFASGGLLPFGIGLVLILGADLGSAIVVQVLSLNIDWLVPLLIGIGGWVFLKAELRKNKQLGRIMLGIAFILIALRFLRETVEPIRDSNFLPAMVVYLENDAVTAFLIGAVLALVMHSSVATVLMCVVLVAIDALPLAVGITLVLGANLGGALVAVWLTRGMNASARRLAIANLAARGATAIICAIALQFDDVSVLSGWVADAQALVLAHLGFNTLLLLFVPFAGRLEAPMTQLIAEDGTDTTQTNGAQAASALDMSVLGSPRLSMACLRREVHRMSYIVENLARPVTNKVFDPSPTELAQMKAQRHSLAIALSRLREYFAQMNTQEMQKKDVKIVSELVDYASNLDAASDIVLRRMVPVALARSQKEVRFSEAGWSELLQAYERMNANMTLAFDLLISEDVEEARQLFLEKDDFVKSQSRSKKRHFARVRNGDETSLASSSQHLETLAALRDFNRMIVSLADPILLRNGQLLETRLVFKSET